MSITGVLAKPFVAVSDYFEGKGEDLPKVDVDYEKEVLFKMPPSVQAALDSRSFDNISVLMAMLNTNSAHWHLHTADKAVRKARWGEHMRSMRETMVSQERWNNLSNWGSMLVMGAGFVSPKIADGIFGSGDQGKPHPFAQKLWDLTGKFPNEAIRREEWRKTFLDTSKGAPQMVQAMSQARQQTGQMEIQTRSMQTQAEQEAMRSKGEAASGVKQDDRALKELIDRTFIQGDPNNTIIRIANGQ